MTDLPTKTARWVDASAIYGPDSVKLVTDKGATIAKVRLLNRCHQSWSYEAGRSRGGNASSKVTAIGRCEQWAEGRGYVVLG